jgi:hypothetical protein
MIRDAHDGYPCCASILRDHILHTAGYPGVMPLLTIRQVTR